MVYFALLEGTLSVIVIIEEKVDSVTRVQILDEVIYISLCANPRGKGWNSAIILSAVSK